MSESAEIDLQPSKLGTKEYWDNIYEGEITNFEDFGDEGEVWFGQDSVDKMVEWAVTNVPPTSAPTVIEIGAGNGNLLFALADAGYAPKRLAGIDYSADAVRLARNIAKERGCDAIEFAEVDFLGGEEGKGLPRVEGAGDGDGNGWTLVLDKGTYDAMALAGRDAEGRRPCDAYPARVAALLKPGGYFLITSCNFTREELLRAFEAPETGLTYHSQIEFPSISFGGAQGSTYCSIAFQKTTKK